MGKVIEFDKDRQGMSIHFNVEIVAREIQPETSFVMLRATKRDTGESVRFDVRPMDIHLYRGKPIHPGWGYRSTLTPQEVMTFFGTTSDELYIVHPSAEQAKKVLDDTVKALQDRRAKKIDDELKKMNDDTPIVVEMDTSNHLFIQVKGLHVSDHPYFRVAEVILKECGHSIDYFLGKASNIDVGDYSITFKWEITYKRFRRMVAEAMKLRAKKCQKKAADREREEGEKEPDRFQVAKVLKLQMPSGGENGRDGLYIADIQNLKTDAVTRVIARNVFDFGFYVYPESSDNTNGVLNDCAWTEEEREAVRWVEKNPPFTTKIRM